MKAKSRQDKANELGGVSREKALLAAGFCHGLADRRVLQLNEFEKDLLKSAGRALAAAAIKLQPTTKNDDIPRQEDSREG